MTLREIAEQLNVEGAISPTPKGWSAGAVRSIWDNRFEYAGFVTLGHHGRGNAKRFRLDIDRRPGRHQPLITEEELRDAVAGVEARDLEAEARAPDVPARRGRRVRRLRVAPPG